MNYGIYRSYNTIKIKVTKQIIVNYLNFIIRQLRYSLFGIIREHHAVLFADVILFKNWNLHVTASCLTLEEWTVIEK